MSAKKYRVRGKLWELQGFYAAGRGYRGYGRLRAFWDTLLHGWSD